MQESVYSPCVFWVLVFSPSLVLRKRDAMLWLLFSLLVRFVQGWQAATPMVCRLENAWSVWASWTQVGSGSSRRGQRRGRIPYTHNLTHLYGITVQRDSCVWVHIATWLTFIGSMYNVTHVSEITVSKKGVDIEKVLTGGQWGRTTWVDIFNTLTFFSTMSRLSYGCLHPLNSMEYSK